MVTNLGRVVFWEIRHALTFAQMRRAVCQRQPSFLFYFHNECRKLSTFYRRDLLAFAITSADIVTIGV